MASETQHESGGPGRPLSVLEMGEALGFSRQHFHALIAAGVFPPPVYDLRTRRPMYIAELQERCLRVVRNRIGEHGRPVLFYKAGRRDKPASARPARPPQPDPRVVLWSRRLDDLFGKNSVTLNGVSALLEMCETEGVDFKCDADVMNYLVRQVRESQTRSQE
jgi:hypothetical protein